MLRSDYFRFQKPANTAACKTCKPIFLNLKIFIFPRIIIIPGIKQFFFKFITSGKKAFHRQFYPYAMLSFGSKRCNEIEIKKGKRRKNRGRKRSHPRKGREREKKKSLIQRNYKRRFSISIIFKCKGGGKRFQVFREHGTKDDWHTNHWSRPWSHRP